MEMEIFDMTNKEFYVTNPDGAVSASSSLQRLISVVSLTLPCLLYL